MRILGLLLGLILFQLDLVAQGKQGAVMHLWHIAYQFHPQLDSGYSIPRLPVDQPAWDIAVERAMVEDPAACAEPLLLILMKLYAAHLICCNQSYDIANDGGRRSSIANAFLRLAAPELHGRPIEFYSSGAPYEYYMKHKQRFHTQAIREEAGRIAKETRRMKKGI